MNDPIFLHIPKGADLGATLDAFKAEALNASVPKPQSLIVLMPAADVLRLTLQLPVVPTHKLQQAATYAAEERLAADIDSQHLTIVETRSMARDRQDVEVAIVDRDRLRNLLSALAAKDLAPTAVYADADCIASKPGDLLLWIDQEDAHWIAPQGSRRTWPIDALEESLSWALADTPAGTVGLRIYASESDFERYATAIESMRSRVVSLQRHTIERPREWLAEQSASARPRNLLHGEFQSQQRHSARWYPWRWSIGVAIAMLLVFAAQLALDTWMTRSRALEVEQRIATKTTALLPAGTAVQNVVPLLERQIVTLSNRSASSSTLETLASIVTPNGVPAPELIALDLQPDRVKLELQTTNVNTDQLSALSAAWSAAGWKRGDTREADGVTTIELVRP